MHKYYQVACPYCNQDAKRVTGKDVYPHRPDLYSKIFYLCAPCKAYVGTHAATGEPLGRVANSALRLAKSQAHAVFDPIWKATPPQMNRGDAYVWLADSLNINPIDCHIGMFDVDMCKRVVEVCINRKRERLALLRIAQECGLGELSPNEQWIDYRATMANVLKFAECVFSLSNKASK